MALEDLADWEKCTRLLAAQEPWWEPGDGSGYHAVTQGYLVGEVVRRICGESLGTFFAKEIAGPIGADFHIGTPPEADDRISRLIPHEPIDPGALEASDIALRTLTNPLITGEVTCWNLCDLEPVNCISTTGSFVDGSKSCRVPDSLRSEPVICGTPTTSPTFFTAGSWMKR